MSWTVRMVGRRLMVAPPNGPLLSTTSLILAHNNTTTSSREVIICVVINAPEGVDYETWVTTLPPVMKWGDDEYTVKRTHYGMCIGIVCPHKIIRGDVWLPEVTSACEMEFGVTGTVSIRIPKEVDEVYEVRDVIDNQANIVSLGRPVKGKVNWYVDMLVPLSSVKAKVVFDNDGKIVSHTTINAPDGVPDTFVAIHPYHW